MSIIQYNVYRFLLIKTIHDPHKENSGREIPEHHAEKWTSIFIITTPMNL